MKLSIWSVLSKLGKKSCSQMFDVDSVSVWTEMCLITQETEIQKPGHQQPLHQEPRGSVPVVETGHMSTSGPVLCERAPLYFLYCQSCSSESSSPSIDCISLSPSVHSSLSF